MLVLTRRIGERVLIGDDVELTVLDVKGDTVRIGVQAPRDTRIQRAELVDAVSKENVDAAQQADQNAEKALKDMVGRRTRTRGSSS
ncbi:carbon storage regulator CsrA [Paramicrobacterium agarici]|uniref:carbon storage regulator CsrA n=1 Tax=Paramicrobacterium agarici TaxID=630514 RepID=UPI0011535DEC|nr:carbon storage regulator CsrA [Microbacterium agarici]TQO23606.1 carbon storage regulator CsrA [Microbacterium agarici]